MAHPPNCNDGRPAFDPVRARELLGQCVLVGITHEDRLRSTGEVVADPDFTAQWIVTLPDA